MNELQIKKTATYLYNMGISLNLSKEYLLDIVSWYTMTNDEDKKVSQSQLIIYKI